MTETAEPDDELLDLEESYPYFDPYELEDWFEWNDWDYVDDEDEEEEYEPDNLDLQ